MQTIFIRFIIHLIFVMMTLVFFKGYSHAGTWIENFNDGPLNSWTEPKHQKEGKRATWQAKDGGLDVWIQTPPRVLRASYALEFTAFPIRADRILAKMTILETHNVGVGIFIGLRSGGSPLRLTYQFLSNSIWGPIVFPNKHPRTRFDIKEIEIVFDRTHFQLLSKGKQILEFQDDNFQKIESLGIIAFVSEVRLAHFVLDNFVISGPSIPTGRPVRPKGKVTVLWGQAVKASLSPSRSEATGRVSLS